MDWNDWLETFRRPLFPLGQTQVTLALILQFCALVVAAIWGSILLRRLLLVRLLRRTPLDASLQDALARIGGYLALAIALLVGLSTIGIELTSLTVLAGALGVGIGFGLQNVVENFVSGLILLAERPIRVGDRVEVEDVAGQVVSIGARSTTILTNDNVAIIVPNSQLVTERVVNWSHGGGRVRYRVAIGVAYGTDLRAVERVLVEVASADPHVLADPPPRAVLVAFGDSSIDFELRVWTADLLERPTVLRSELLFATWEAFARAGIEMPFPQRDLHVRGPVRVEIAPPERPGG